MRLLLILLCSLAATQAQAAYYRNGEFRDPCSDLPPVHAQNEPSVPYEVIRLRSDDVQVRCGGPFERVATACARWVDPKSSAAGWVIYIDSDIPEADFRCVLLYEKAHLPPNNWADQKWETYVRHGGNDPR